MEAVSLIAKKTTSRFDRPALVGRPRGMVFVSSVGPPRHDLQSCRPSFIQHCPTRAADATVVVVLADDTMSFAQTCTGTVGKVGNTWFNTGRRLPKHVGSCHSLHAPNSQFSATHLMAPTKLCMCLNAVSSGVCLWIYSSSVRVRLALLFHRARAHIELRPGLSVKDICLVNQARSGAGATAHDASSDAMKRKSVE